METNDAFVEVFWKAYQSLDTRERLDLATRILQDAEISEDWIDHLLIERARKEPGSDVSLDTLSRSAPSII